jgi:serine/threonine protein phosphatase 1
MKKIVISDIHGCAKTFKALLRKIDLNKADTLYLLGDYIDRGHDSKGVIDTIFNLRANGIKVECLMGNHEIMLLNALKSGDALEKWFRDGGRKTLESFGVYDLRDIPQRYMDFFQSLPSHIEVDNYILVHAGVDFNLDDPLSDKEKLVWIRHWYSDIDYRWLRARTIVHGHTPTSVFEIQMMHQQLAKNRYIDIDAGCVFEQYATEGYAHLCAFNLTTQEITFHKNIDEL